MSMLNLDLGTKSEPYDLFVFAINAEQTREKYITRLKKFFEIVGIDPEKKLDDARKFQDIYEQGQI